MPPQNPQSPDYPQHSGSRQSRPQPETWQRSERPSQPETWQSAESSRAPQPPRPGNGTVPADGTRRWPGQSSGASRRSVLRGVATVGVVGAAAAAGAGAVVGLTGNSSSAPTEAAVMSTMPTSAMAGPLVVYISDTTTGVMDVFGGTGQIRLHDSALVSQLLSAIK